MDLELKSAYLFKTERSESLKSVSKQHVQRCYSELLPPVASRGRGVASLDLDFRINGGSDPLAKGGNKFIDILRTSITKLK